MKINKIFIEFSNQENGLLILRFISSYFLFINHGIGKLMDPSKWNWLGSTFTKYFFGLLDFANSFFGFLAAFSESICAALVLLGLYTRFASSMICLTMLVAILYHITGSGGIESASLYFSIFFLFLCIGPGKYSLDNFIKNKNN